MPVNLQPGIASPQLIQAANTRRQRGDPVPHVPAAGVHSAFDPSTTQECLAAPESLNSTDYLPYSHRYKNQPSLRYIHGITNDPQLLQNIQDQYGHLRHGVNPSHGTLRAGDTLQQLPTSELAAYLLQQNEQIYQSKTTKPIGRSYIRGFPVDPDYSHGIVSDSSESAKNLIYRDNNRDTDNKNPGTVGETNEEKENVVSYVTSNDHQQRYVDPLKADKDVTRPINRKYVATTVDVHTYRHGKVDKDDKKALNSSEGVIEALKMRDGMSDKTAIVNARAEQSKELHSKPLGRSVQHYQLPASFTVAGVRSEHDQSTASHCLNPVMTGDVQTQHHSVDTTIGRSVSAQQRLRGSMDGIAQHSSDRTYGVPSIRHDRVAPVRRSIANPMTYANEDDATKLVFPFDGVLHGVQYEDLTCKRTEEEVRSIFAATGLTYESVQDEEFQQICQQARERYGKLTVDTFRHAYNHLTLAQQQSSS